MPRTVKATKNKKQPASIPSNDYVDAIKNIYFDPKHLPLSTTVPRILKEWAQKEATASGLTLSKYITKLIFNEWLQKNLPPNTAISSSKSDISQLAELDLKDLDVYEVE